MLHIFNIFIIKIFKQAFLIMIPIHNLTYYLNIIYHKTDFYVINVNEDYILIKYNLEFFYFNPLIQLFNPNMSFLFLVYYIFSLRNQVFLIII